MAGSSQVEPGQDEIGAAIFLALSLWEFRRTALRPKDSGSAGGAQPAAHAATRRDGEVRSLWQP
jgi:hypothetical protein